MNEELREQLDGLVQELLAEEPAALAVLLFGNFARGTAGPFSDVDVRVFTAEAPRRRDGCGADAWRLVTAVRRMALGTAAILRGRLDALPFPGDVAGLLCDGSIEAYLVRGLSVAAEVPDGAS